MPNRARRGEVSRPLRVVAPMSVKGASSSWMERALVQHDVDLVVLHRGVEILLDDRAEPVDLVDEQHVARVEVGQQSGQVAGLVQHGARRDAQLRSHLVGDDVGQRGLSQARRSVQQHVVERVAPHQRGLDEDAQVFDDLVLSREVAQLPGADFVLELEIAFGIAYDRHGTKIRISREKKPVRLHFFRGAVSSAQPKTGMNGGG